MAKKKLSQSQQEKTHRKQEDSVAMENDEASVKLERLKSLNQRLLREAVERRQEVNSLARSKRSLESELTQSNSAMEALRLELAQVCERVVHLELERNVVSVFVALQVNHQAEVVEQKMKELESKIDDFSIETEENERRIGLLNEKLNDRDAELESERESSGRITGERNEMKAELDIQIKEANGLRTNFIELEKGKKQIEEQIGKLQVEYSHLNEEKQEMERKFEVLMNDKNSVEKNLAESNKLIEKLREEIVDVTKETQRVEEEKKLEMDKVSEMEIVVNGLSDKVMSMRTEEERLRSYVAELEKKCNEGEAREKDMGREIGELMEDKKLNEKICEGLIEDKNLVEKNMNDALNKLHERSWKVDDLVNEKIKLVIAKDGLASKVDSLQNEVVESRRIVLYLEQVARDKIAQIENLESEISSYENKIEQIQGERDDVRKLLDEEKQNVTGLKETMEEMERQIEESENVIGGLKAENLKILGEKKEVESQRDFLQKEIASLKKSLDEGKSELDAMQGKVELANANSKVVMNLLRDAAAFCSKDERDDVETDLLDGKQINGEEMNTHAVEPEIIKNAFMNKESKVENLKRQLELLQISVAEAHKKKNFWTVLSSVTTLLAAVSLAFVAHGR